MRVDFEQAVCVLKSGEPLIFPTDTVVGIGVAALYAAGLRELCQAKGRDEGKPIAWLVPSSDSISVYGEDVPLYAHKLAQAYWPGAMTLVVKASRRVPSPYRSAQGTIGLRMPASKSALRLMQAVGSPIATTSANIAGMPAPGNVDDVDAGFSANIAIYAPSQPHTVATAGVGETSQFSRGIASAVIDCTGSSPRVLRPGTISTHEMVRVACDI